ncbi:MAG: MipA/OmpV family protein [Proteobacteria bacterium]|jgi:MipA family protein|nr:MipA/OmpV family protein [Pseudomonadota bacterium]
MIDFKSNTAVFILLLATYGHCFPAHAQDASQGESTTDKSALPGGTQQLPKWELALGIGATRLPHYPGSASSRNFLFPAVIPLYRGEYLKFDDDGLRGEIYKSDRFYLDFSVDFNLAVDSSDVEERLGMPDLDNIIQLGPSLEWMLKNDDNDQWLLKLGLRAAIAVDGVDLNSTGFTANPQLTWYRKFEAGQRDWRLGVTGGLLFGTENYHDFYYQVSPEFVTAQRAQYDASGGYGGFRGITTLVSRNEKSWIALFARYENYSGAINKGSDLLPSSDGLTFGFVYSRFLFRSKTLVNAER